MSASNSTRAQQPKGEAHVPQCHQKHYIVPMVKVGAKTYPPWLHFILENFLEQETTTKDRHDANREILRDLGETREYFRKVFESIRVNNTTAKRHLEDMRKALQLQLYYTVMLSQSPEFGDLTFRESPFESPVFRKRSDLTLSRVCPVALAGLFQTFRMHRYADSNLNLNECIRKGLKAEYSRQSSGWLPEFLLAPLRKVLEKQSLSPHLSNTLNISDIWPYELAEASHSELQCAWIDVVVRALLVCDIDKDEKKAILYNLGWLLKKLPPEDRRKMSALHKALQVNSSSGRRMTVT